MSPKLPVYRTANLVKLVERAGFVFSRQKGSHMIFYCRGIRVVIPDHGKSALHPKIIKDTLLLLEKAKSK